MGTWDDKPWGNDTAADWFGDLFDETKLAEHERLAGAGPPRGAHHQVGHEAAEHADVTGH